MDLPTHPLLTLVECNANGLKSMLTHYIDATVNNQFASLKDSILLMIQSGQIDIDQQSHDVATFDQILPPPTQANTDQSSAQCSHEYSNDTLTTAQEHQNTQNEVSLSNTINTNDQMIKQEFDDEYVDGQEIDNDNVAKCENCKKGICNSVCDNYGYSRDTDTRENRDEPFEIQQNFNAAFENNQFNPSIISNDILPSSSPTNPTNTEPLIKQQCLQGSSITSIPLDFTNNAALNDIAIDEQIEGQSTQIQSDEFDDHDDVDDDYSDGGGDEYLNQPNWDNGDCDFDLENSKDHLNNDVSAGDGDQTDIETNLDEAQSQIDVSAANNTQINNQNDEENVINERSVSARNLEQSTSSTSGVRSSTRKRIQTKVFGDLVQPNLIPLKSDQANKNVKKAKRKQILDDDEDTDSDDYADQEDQASDAIREEITTKSTTNPIQPNRIFPQCPHCPKSFERKADFKRHLRVHSGERPFPCDQCGKRFNQVGNLTKHQLIHQNIKRFRCHECDKQFTQKSQIIAHLRIHSGDRPFTCRHCDKSFADLTNRKRHEQAIHLHVKPYRCKQCGHTATERSHVITHIRVIHFGLPRSIKEQRALNIIDERDPKELVEKM